MSDDAPAPLFAPRSASRFALVVVALVGGIVAWSALERPKTASVEKFEQLTAAGDRRYYAPPDPPLAIPEPVFTWQGRAWAPATDDKLKIDDPDMRRVGRDEATGLSIYRTASGKPPGYFIKKNVGEFFRLQPR